MRRLKTVVYRPIRVVSNKGRKPKLDTDSWLQIRDQQTGEILHTGQPPYIMRVAAKRYGHKVVS